MRPADSDVEAADTAPRASIDHVTEQYQPGLWRGIFAWV